MSRKRRIVTIAAACIAGFIVLLLVAAVGVMQTDWFRNYVRQKIVAVTEESTGGRVELSRFNFDIWHLRATMENFILHGTEPAGQPPLLRAPLLQVDLRLFAGKTLDLRAILLDRPSANIIVYPDGRTNVPEPKVKKKSDKTGLETIVDLAIGRFDLRDGTLLFADQKLPLDAHGENLRAQLDYSRVARSYQGRVSMTPLYVTYAKNQPAKIDVNLPVTIEKDRIAFDKARIATSESEVILSGAVEHLVSPRIALSANARVALAEVEKVAGIRISPQSGKNLPGTLTAEVSMTSGDNRIRVTNARVALGNSSLEASGDLKDPAGKGSLQFHSRLAVDELGRLFQVAGQPGGIVTANGNVALTGDSDYRVTGNVEGARLSITQSGRRISNIHLASSINADPKRIELNGVRLDAFGGNFSGNAAIQEMRRFELDGRLRNFDLNTLARTFLDKPLGYSGVISGPVKAQGDLKAPGTSGIQANAQLAVTPASGGVPVSGRLNARYSGTSDNVRITDSYLALPHSRLNLAGDLGKQLDVRFRSTDLGDFLPAMQAASKEPVKELPVALRNGEATFNGTVRGTLQAPQIAGQLAASNFSVEGRQFDVLRADVAASASGARLDNLNLSRGKTQIQAAANIELRDWKVLPNQKLALNTTIRNGDVADLLALAGQPDIPITGTVNADIHLNGTAGNPAGTAQLVVTNGVAYEQPFQRAEANMSFSNQRVMLAPADVTMDAGRVHLTGTFEHPAESWTTGTIQAELSTNQIQLALLRPVVKQFPGLSGTLAVDARVAGGLQKGKTQTEFALTAVNGGIKVQGLRAEGENYGDLTATARTSGSVVEYRVDSDFAGSTLRVNGNTSLQPGYPTTAKANMQNLPVERVLALAQRKDIRVRGNVSGSAQFTGTLENPNATVDLSVAKAVVYDEALDRVQLRATYSNVLIDIPRLEIVADPGRIEGSANYQHPAGDLQNGQLTFKVASTEIQLARLKTVQGMRPGLGGVLRIIADGAATVRKQGSTQPRVLFSRLDGNIAATGLVLSGRALGDARLEARTTGERLAFALNSNLAGAQVTGGGDATLRGDYPLNAKVQFTNLTYSGLRPLLGRESIAQPLFDIFVNGDVTVTGPALKPEALTGRLSLPRLEIAAKSSPTNGSQPVSLHNDGPITITLDRSVLKVERAHMVGPQTDILLTGTASTTGSQALDLDLNANTNLGLLQQMSRNIYASGAIVVQTAIRGQMAKPQVNGRLELKNASMNYIDFPNGISNANGLILFNGTTATVQNLTAESGGGKLTAGGFVSYGGPSLAYGLRANADSVRVRYPPGASIVASAQVNLTGTAQRSLLAGNVTLERLGFSPRSDFGSMLSRSAEPAKVPSAPTGPLEGMRLDVAIKTSPNVSLETSLATRLQAAADLRLRGTATNPGMVGRVNVTQGELVFFGTKYTVNQGSVAFYDPTRIYPVLNIDLQTVAKGVDVVLNVSGPIDNMKLSHRSDPPLQFNEIVALLATGRTPTSDPNLVAKEPATPPQSLQQMGESALLTQAVANPVSSRLERVFGVSQLKIDPTFTSGSELPQARLTLQQQITSNLTFTYITNVAQTNSQIIRVEWALNPQWVAIATREETGRFGVDFFYKRSFR